MRTFKSLLIAVVFSVITRPFSIAQGSSHDKVVITGVRFAYPLVEKWIKDYTAENPKVQIVIEARTITDPEKYDLLIEAYDQDRLLKEGREFISIGRYALLPVANAKSAFAKVYGEKGLDEKIYKQIFFHDIYAEKNESVTVPFTIYTRLQKAGAPITFSKYFGYEQQQIKGKSIAGADEHLIKALLKDETGITYTLPGLAFDLNTRKVTDGLAVIPVDLDGNGRVSKDEKSLESLDQVIGKLETEKVKNVPIEYLHFSIAKNNTNQEAKKFLSWVASHGGADLHHFGFLNADVKRFEAEKAKLVKFLAAE